MRAFAVLLVVVAHAGLQHAVPGGSGVTTFFAISGFIITYLMFREQDETGGFSAARFYARRAAKLMPPFVVVVLVPTLIYWLWLGHKISAGAVSSQIGFSYNWWFLHAGGSGILPGSGVLWSLAVEEQFYIVVAVAWLLLVKTKRYVRNLVGFAAVVTVYSLAAKFVLASGTGNTNRIYYGSDTRADGVALGILTAGLVYEWQHGRLRLNGLRKAVASDATVPVAALIFLLTLALRAPYFRDTVRYPIQGLCACAVIMFGFAPGRGPLRNLFNKLVRGRVVQLIGRARRALKKSGSVRPV
jgi:peptidoglycan/LPS O-acetylase OafA/YrhL